MVTATALESQATIAESEPVVARRPAVSSSPDSRSILGRSLDTDGTGVSNDDPVFYRYKDANGVIYITRNKPENVEYEVLRR